MFGEHLLSSENANQTQKGTLNFEKITISFSEHDSFPTLKNFFNKIHGEANECNFFAII